MSEINWNQPQRLSSYAIFSSALLFMKWAFRLGWFLLIPLVLNFSWQSFRTAALVFLVLIVLAAIFGGIYYYFFKFWLDDKELVVEKWFFRLKRISIPYDRIQSVAIEQSFWQQIMDVYALKIDSAGSKEEEVLLHALDIEVANAFKIELQQRTQADIIAPSEVDGIEADNFDRADKKKGKTLVSIGFGKLLLLGISENHLRSSVYIFVFMSYLYQYKNYFGLERFAQQQLNEAAFNFKSLSLWINILGLFIVISLVLSLVKTILKYWNFKFKDFGQYYVASFGLFKTSETHLKHKRIQKVSLIQNPFQRLFNFWELHLTQVGASDAQQQGKLKILGVSQDLGREWLQSYTEESEVNLSQKVNIHPMRKRYIWSRLGLLLLIALGIAIYFQSAIYNWPLLVLMAFLGYLHFRSIKLYEINLFNHGLEKRSAFFEFEQNFVRFEKIQGVNYSNGPISKLFGFVDLKIQTAGGSLSIPYLPKREASYLRDFLLYKVESQNKPWM
jgi:putative membrane protein